MYISVLYRTTHERMYQHFCPCVLITMLPTFPKHRITTDARVVHFRFSDMSNMSHREISAAAVTTVLKAACRAEYVTAAAAAAQFLLV